MVFPVSPVRHPLEICTAIQIAAPIPRRRVTPRIRIRSRFTEVYTHARRRMSMTWKSVVPVLAFLCATLGPTNPLLAQAVQTSALTGTVKDSTGAVLPGVTVNVSSPQQIGGVQTSVTDSQGIYRFPALRP